VEEEEEEWFSGEKNLVLSKATQHQQQQQQQQQQGNKSPTPRGLAAHRAISSLHREGGSGFNTQPSDSNTANSSHGLDPSEASSITTSTTTIIATTTTTTSTTTTTVVTSATSSTAAKMMDEHLQRVEKDLGDPTFLQYFRRFLQQTYCAENLYFWEVANKWNEDYPSLSPQQRIERAQLIHSLYFAPLSENELNLDVLVKEKVDRRIADQDVDQNIFLETQFAVFSLLSSDSYPKFTDSELYQHYKGSIPPLIQYTIFTLTNKQ